MRRIDPIELDDLLFDEPLDAFTSAELRDVLAYDDDGEDGQELGYRALLERPESLSSTLRTQLH